MMFTTYYMWIFYTIIIARICAQSLICPSGGYPNNLAPMSIWTKSSKNNEYTVYKIGNKSLVEDGFKQQTIGASTILLNRGQPSSCSGSCTFKLAANQRLTDGMVLHQENVLGIPSGYEYISQTDEYYCAREGGNCGATVPIFRYRTDSPVTRYAYSFGPMDSLLPEYMKELMPICYGWKDDDSEEKVNAEGECPTIEIVNHSKIIYQPQKNVSTIPVGGTAMLKCDTNYIPSGTTKVVCTVSGWYPSETLGECIPQNQDGNESSCPSLPVFSRGRIFYSHPQAVKHYNGTIARLQCDAGFLASGNNKETVCLNGQWSSTLSECKKIIDSCQKLPDVPNGEIKYSSNNNNCFFISDKAEIKCFAGFEIDGEHELTCTSNGWFPKGGMGNCKLSSHSDKVRVKRQAYQNPQDCILGMSTVLNGHIVYSNGAVFGPFPSGTTAVLICESGYANTGEIHSICQHSTWYPSNLDGCIPGSNSKSDCMIGTMAPLWGRISYNQGGDTGPYPSGTIGKLTCTEGFPKGDSLTVCINGLWHPSVLGSCSQSFNGGTQCLSFLPPTFGHITYSNGQIFPPYQGKTIANLSCLTGFQPESSKESICDNGVWDPPNLICVVLNRPLADDSKVCSVGLPPVLNGYISYSNNQLIPPFWDEVQAKLTCISGTPLDDDISICRNRSWHPPTLTCSTISPLSSPLLLTNSYCYVGLPPVLNGNITYSNKGGLPFPTGTIATITCNLGYSSTGPSTSECQNSLWNPILTTYCVEDRNKIQTCPAMLPPMNGMIKYSPESLTSYPPNTVAALFCEIGHTPYGNMASVCTNGQWNPPLLGTCRAGIAGGLFNSVREMCIYEMPSVMNGQIKYSLDNILAPFPSGSTATLTCNPSFVAFGATLSVCNNGIWNPPVLGQCMQQSSIISTNTLDGQCKRLPVPHGGNIVYSEESRNGTYPPGTSASLICESGYAIFGTSVAMCALTGWTPFTGIGTCVSLSLGKQDNSVINSELQCLPMLPLQNGEVVFSENLISGHYKPGTVAKLYCQLGYTTNGNVESVCRNGIWAPLLGNCRPGLGLTGGPRSCTKIILPKNAKEIYYIQSGSHEDYEAGTTAILICKPGYAVNGRTTSTCTNTGWMYKLGTCEEANYFV